MSYDQNIVDALKKAALPLTEQPSTYNALLEYIGDAQIVLLGEATHGTHQFYDIRAQLSKRLITEKNFNAITIEGDWPDAYQINNYIENQKYTKASDALASFDRFPTWMWRNVPMVKFAEWLHGYNQGKESHKQANFYGLDLYSFYRSIHEVITCLEKIDPAAAAQARYHYSCFDQYAHDPQAYGYAVFTKAIESCSDAVVEQLKRLLEQDWEYLAQGEVSADKAFYIAQNARVVKNAEQYYRSLFSNEANTWNIRDSHMHETINELIKHYQLKGIETPKLIIWAHNSHTGNAAATQMSEHGEYNIGQLIKEQFGAKAISIGFTTYHGTVSAASDWHAPVERKIVREALPNSYEALFHATQIPDFLLLLNNKDIVPSKMLERAIGVIYRPETERASHYFYANLAEQFDAIIHCDKSSAIEPLEPTSRWIEGEAPESYPSGL
jgi:erythromycin esterase-like protein